MNDPHVERLWYTVQHAQTVDFEKAPPLKWSSDAFKLYLEAGSAQFDMLLHCATEAEARDVVEPFIRGWELQADLAEPSARFRLKFQKPEIVDRNPTAGHIHVVGAALELNTTFDAAVHLSKGAYFEPAPELHVNDVVYRMWDKYRRHVDGATELASAVNYCITEVEALGNGRKNASQMFGISFPVLQKMADLSANKGGKEARKASGALKEYTSHERSWLEAALRMIVRRVAEHAKDQSVSNQQLTFNDLPPLNQPTP